MIEKHIVLEDIDTVVFYGVGNAHLQMIRSLFPKLRIVARDNVIRVLGDEEQMAAFEENIERIRRHILKFNSLREEDILDIIKGGRSREVPEDVVVYTSDFEHVHYYVVMQDGNIGYIVTSEPNYNEEDRITEYTSHKNGYGAKDESIEIIHADKGDNVFIKPQWQPFELIEAEP